MNKNEMLNDKPIFVAKIRIFRSLILAAIGLMFALVICSVAQESEANKLVQVALWVFGGLCGMGGVFYLYITLIFKKIMLFDDRIEVHFVNKVIVRKYSQIKSFKLVEYGPWPTTKQLFLKCEPKFRHAYLSNTLLHKNELYKIKEILIKKGVKDDDWI
ncbi:MAG: hypothetical protein SOZ73_00975 [Campylobacter sp.]|uniref:hypothetical protein n=1 Tax=Campylobacter sp. TaxID=205 RepID=UPI002A86FF44|nr:hypothetical protein [Campylobacter sp.]MCI7014185.1 hypothetical protein [Campylobacter sp.]MDY3663119.1 hypothetical protein [Campylobacter sp.]MDY3667967.1 hypothetical protein [Campylobacter sp.]MDY3775785.1 hypothetical protein [Campylobacter sp.]MDY4012238.1 hypothetical protein [Campylobacter sp.]